MFCVNTLSRVINGKYSVYICLSTIFHAMYNVHLFVILLCTFYIQGSLVKQFLYCIETKFPVFKENVNK